MSPVASRVPAIPREKWTDATREVFAAFEPEGWENGSKFNVLQLFANHPPLASAFLNYSRRLLDEPILSVRLREIVILRVAWRHRCEYEWVQHVAIGGREGLGPEHVEAIKQGAEAPVWSNLERCALRAVDQLCETSNVDHETWEALSKELELPQMLELLMLIGTYTMLAWTFNATGLHLEPGVAGERPW